MKRVFLIAFSAGLAMLWAGPSRAQNVPGRQMGRTPFIDIDERAAQVKPDDEASVRALADAIFEGPFSYPRMPSVMEDVVKDHLVNAELAYRKGNTPGVREADMVKAINALADKLGAPDYGKTSESQVRYVRISLALSEPHFVGAGMTADNVPDHLSPLAAIHVMQSLVEQKLLQGPPELSPNFDVTPAEWDADPEHHQSYAERLQRYQAFMQAAQRGQVRGRLVIGHNERGQSLRASLAKGIAALSLADGFDLVTSTLTTLGMTNIDGKQHLSALLIIHGLRSLSRAD